MTNKKFKLAATAMALTACVAAQPMMANAADDVDAAGSAHPDTPKSGDPETAVQSAPDAGSINQEEQTTKEAFGEKIDVRYDPETKTENPDGSSTITGEIVKKDETPDKPEETGEPEKEGETEGKGETGQEELAPEGGQPDSSFEGDAQKTEKDESTSTEVKPNPGAEAIPDTSGDRKTETTTDPDGSTTIKEPTVTPGTETTTTTGSGSATGTTTETEKKEFDKGEFDLEKELGGKPDIDWDKVQENPGAYDNVGNGYKVSNVQTDGNQQTLTLTKTETAEGSMTSDDIAKLVDAEKTDLGDGSYLLTRTEDYTDENGNTVSRTTYITVKESGVEITTTTTLTVTRERETHNDTVTVDNNFKLPEITVTDKENSENKQTISSNELDLLIRNARSETDGDRTTYYAEETREDGVKREYTITVDSKASELSAAEIAERLGSGFVADGDEVYYVDANGNRAKLSVEQTEKIRQTLSYTVSLTETKKGSEQAPGKNEATEKARMDAVRDALNKAVDDLLAKEKISPEEAKELKRTIQSTQNFDLEAGGDFTAKVGGKDFVLHYTAANVKDTPTPKPDESGKTDINDHEVTGEAFVTGGSSHWSEGRADSGIISGKIDSNINSDLSIPDGIAPVEKDGSLIYTFDRDNKTYEIRYSAPTQEQIKLIEQNLRAKGLSEDDIKAALASPDLKWVSWNVTAPETVPDPIETKDLWNGDHWTFDETTGTLTITHASGTTEVYRGLTYDAKTGTYKGKDPSDSNVTYEIKTSTDASKPLTRNEIQALLRDEYGEVHFVNDSTVTYVRDGKTYTLTFTNPGETTLKVSRSESRTLTEASKEDMLTELKKELESLQEGESLTLNGTTVTMTNGKYLVDNEAQKNVEEVVKIFEPLISNFVNYNELSKSEIKDLLKKQYQEAKNTGDTTGQWFHSDHADLTISTTLTDKDGNVIDSNAIIVGTTTGKAPELRHSSNVDIVVGGNGTLSNINSKVTYDNGRAEYEHNMGNMQGQGLSGDENYYALTGTVVYGNYQIFTSKQEAEKSAGGKIIVTIQNGYRTEYRIYENEAPLSAYGYMSKSANGCNRGGYDLSINHLTYVNNKVVAQTKETYSATLIRTRTTANLFEQLHLDALSHSEPYQVLAGTGYNGNYEASRNDSFNWKDGCSSGVKGTGTGKYRSFFELLRNTFSGTKENVMKDDGSFTYSYTTETPLEAKSMEKVTNKTANVSYTYKTVETRDVLIPGETVIVITPDEDPVPPTTPEQNETPVTPENPELPPVQDAAPDAPVLPTNVVLPAVQDAHALPQTGVNWLAALGMAFSGALLMAAGAFTSLKYKEKH